MAIILPYPHSAHACRLRNFIEQLYYYSTCTTAVDTYLSQQYNNLGTCMYIIKATTRLHVANIMTL